MKHIFILAIALLGLSITMHAQKTTAAAEKALKQKFPNAREVKWDKEKKNEYEASFVVGGKKVSANFSGTGEWLETEMAIPQSAAPKAVIDGFNRAHTGAAITAVYQIESKEGKRYFEIEYTLKGKAKEAKISADGKMM